MPQRMPAAGAIALIAVAVLLPAAFGWLVTTFLFAFSGGQVRMVAVVNLGALAVIALGIVVAGVAWPLRSRTAAVVAALVASAGGWVAAVVIEWVLSFWLGA